MTEIRKRRVFLQAFEHLAITVVFCVLGMISYNSLMPSYRCRVRKLKSKTMGDAAKPYFVKRAKERGTTDDEDFRRGHPQQDYLIMDDYAKGYSSKMEKGPPKKKLTPGNYGNTPRKGPYAVSSNPYAFKNPIYSQPVWITDNHKDQSKRWLSDELGNADTWREFKPGPRIPVLNRPRKDSFQESEDVYRWQDGRGCRTVRRLFHKDLTSLETMSEMEAGSPGNVSTLSGYNPEVNRIVTEVSFLSHSDEFYYFQQCSSSFS